METSEKLKAANLNQSILSAADSHVRTSPALESSEESPTEQGVDSGLNSLGLLGYFDLDSYSLKTSQVSLLTNQCDEYLETFPRSGSMRNGKVFQRPPLVPLTFGTGFGYLPTPDKSLGMLRGGISIGADAMTSFRKEMGETRPSGAKIGSSLRWCPEYIREALRTGGLVNPAWLEVLMGFPENWWTPPTEPSETP